MKTIESKITIDFKTFAWLGLLLLTAMIGQAANDSIRFEAHTLEEAKELAKQRKKMIFVDVYTEWCRPCKWMAQNAFKAPEVAEFFNEHFVNAKIDAEKQREFTQEYGVQVYPTLIVLDADGNTQHRIAGALTAERLLEFAEIASDPMRNFAYFEGNYEKKKHDKTFLYQYIQTLMKSYDRRSGIYEEYFALLSEDEKMGRSNWNIWRFHAFPGTEDFTFLLDNLDKMRELYGRDTVDSKIAGELNGLMYSAIRDSDDVKLDSLRTVFTSLDLYETRKYELNVDITLAREAKDTKWLLELFEEYLSTYGKDQAFLWNNCAWEIHALTEDMTMLKKAEKMVLRSLELQRHHATIDTHAHILFKMGKKKAAIKKMEEAIALAKEDKEVDLKVYTDELEKMKK